MWWREWILWSWCSAFHLQHDRKVLLSLPPHHSVGRLEKHTSQLVPGRKLWWSAGTLSIGESLHCKLAKLCYCRLQIDGHVWLINWCYPLGHAISNLFPSIPACPGVQIKHITFCVFSAAARSMPVAGAGQPAVDCWSDPFPMHYPVWLWSLQWGDCQSAAGNM